jgi:hypothetical protein
MSDMQDEDFLWGVAQSFTVLKAPQDRDDWKAKV